LPVQMSKVVVDENGTILVELVHEILRVDAVVLYTANPKVIMTAKALPESLHLSSQRWTVQLAKQHDPE